MSLAMDGVYQGDCVELLKKVDEASVDLAFADPVHDRGRLLPVLEIRGGERRVGGWATGRSLHANRRLETCAVSLLGYLDGALRGGLGAWRSRTLTLANGSARIT